ncbi:hypothetical protein [Streptomyces sp. NBC_01089]|uniref:hypothetical protein n=1 Tax=Streptomyces sp. NBC_01089 TaxID=2903747 RepID=UPI00386DCBE1|nr:hypothetical protein OG510_21560 [Streptomyces sp. NBC_01089]
MARPESRKKVMGWAAAATLLTAAPLLAACSGDAHAHSSSASHDSSSPSPSASDNSGASDSSGAPSDGGSGAQADDQSTVSSAVGAWVDAVIQQDAKRVCRLSSVPGKGSEPPKATTPQMCDASTTQQMAVGLKSMSKAFTPKNASGRPKVKVDAPTPQGDKAVVPAAKVMIDGQPLRKILLSRSHNVDPKTFTFKAEADKINGKWYVGDSDTDSGTQTLKPRTP